MEKHILTQERADVITKILSEDETRAKDLVSLSVEEAVGGINALGHDFTAEELVAYGKAVENARELSDAALAGVAGGAGGNMEENSIIPWVILPPVLFPPKLPIWPTLPPLVRP